MKEKGTTEQNYYSRAAKQVGATRRLVRTRKCDKHFHIKGTAVILTLAALLLLAFVPSQSHAQDITTGLVGHWMLDETSGTTAADSSGNSNDGTLQSMNVPTVWTNGPISGGLAFENGSDDWVDFGTGATDVEIGLPVTVSGWVMPLDMSGDDMTIFHSNLEEDRYSGYLCVVEGRNDATVYSQFGDGGSLGGGSRRSKRSATTITEGIWQHVVCVIRGANDMDIYINGVDAGGAYSGSGGAITYRAAGRAGLNIADWTGGAGNNDHGNMILDDVRVYNRALTPADVTALYNTAPCFKGNQGAAVEGEQIYNENYRVMQYCDGTGWQSMGKGASIIHGEKTEDRGVDCPNIGDRCADDTINAGTTVGGLTLFAAACDIGMTWDGSTCTGSQTFLEWKTSRSTTTGTDSLTDGVANTDAMATAGIADHPAAQACRNIGADWYLPARDELEAIYDNLVDQNGDNIAGGPLGSTYDFNTTTSIPDGFYKSSSQNTANAAWSQRFSNGLISSVAKDFASAVRCVKRGTQTTETAGLVGWWRLDEASGTLVDASGNGNDSVTETNITYGENGPTSQSIGFNGTDSFVEIANSSSLDLGSAITVALWVKTPGYPTTPPTERIISKGNAFAGGTNGAWGIITNSGNMRSRVIGPLGEARGNGTSPPPDTWVHYAFTYDGTTLTDYYNGAFNSSDTQATGDFSRSAIPVLIGELDSGGQHYEGLVDDVRIYNFALDANQIDELYHASSDFYTPNAVDFDGTNDWLDTASPIGLTDGSKGTISAWFKLDENTADRRILRNSTARVIIWYDAAGEMRIWGEDASNANLLDLRTTGFGGDTTGWHHLLASWDLSDPTKRHLYIDGVSDMSVVNFTNGNINYANGFYRIGANSAGSDMWDGYMADLWFDHDTYIDLSNPNERAKFISANGGAVYLGANGEIPTGASPDIFLSGDTGTWHTNDGTLAGFTENGAIADAPTTPPGSKQPRYCSNPTQPEGTLIYNDDDDVMQYCDGFTYRPLGPPGDGGGGCSDPSGSAGFMYYNTDFATLMYCEGDEWIGVRGDPTASVIAQGLVGHWTLDETSGTFADSSVNNNIGTQSGGVTYASAGVIGNAATFDGTDDYIPTTVSADHNFTDDFTLSAWIKHSGAAEAGSGDGWRIVSRHRDPGDDVYTLRVGDSSSAVANGRVQFLIRPDGSVYSVASTTNIKDGNWYLVTAVRRGSDIEIYINGTLENTTSSVSTDPLDNYTTQPFMIGRSYNSAEYFAGDIDDVRLYDRALGLGEIQALYNLGDCPQVGDVCNDGSVFASLAGNGTSLMYTTPNDSPSKQRWADVIGGTGFVSIGGLSTTDGETNTNTVVTIDADSDTAGFQTHPAAQYCHDLVAHGHDDWYLPAFSELLTLFTYRNEIGGFTLSGPGTDAIYWTSNEGSDSLGRRRDFDGTTAQFNTKSQSLQVRCVRKD